MDITLTFKYQIFGLAFGGTTICQINYYLCMKQVLVLWNKILMWFYIFLIYNMVKGFMEGELKLRYNK